MGSPDSAIVANLYMEFFVELTLSSAQSRSEIRTLCIIEKGVEDEFLNHLNNICTIETRDSYTLHN